MHKIVKGHLEIRECKFGKGLFASSDIKRGTEIISIKGRKITFKEAVNLGEKESYPIQVSAQTYLLPEAPVYLANHSCKPNCGVTADLKFIAIEDIKEGEELFWDYSTSMLERSWTMNCKCGRLQCRGVIQDFDLLPVSLQKKYFSLNIVQPFIKSFYDNYKSYSNKFSYGRPVLGR